MADLYFPQLNTGAIAHYPVRSTLATRTVANILPGGDMFLYPDEGANRKIWSWEYAGLTFDEAAVLQGFFNTCDGPLRPFTFLDPVGNLLASNSSFRAPAWQLSAAATFTGDPPGPFSNSAVTLVNRGQAVQDIWQTLPVPANYIYCFSMYVTSSMRQSVTLFRRSKHSEATVSCDALPNWTRICTSGNLQDPTVG